jgi:putative endonuclease
MLKSIRTSPTTGAIRLGPSLCSAPCSWQAIIENHFSNLMEFFSYMLRLQNDQVYVGSTDNLQRRYQEHFNGTGCKTTRDSKPVAMIYSESHPDWSSAILRQRQLKKWSRAKNLALAERNLDQVHRLSKRET